MLERARSIPWYADRPCPKTARSILFGKDLNDRPLPPLVDVCDRRIQLDVEPPSKSATEAPARAKPPKWVQRFRQLVGSVHQLKSSGATVIATTRILPSASLVTAARTNSIRSALKCASCGGFRCTNSRSCNAACAPFREPPSTNLKRSHRRVPRTDWRFVTTCARQCRLCGNRSRTCRGSACRRFPRRSCRLTVGGAYPPKTVARSRRKRKRSCNRCRTVR
jgi:hypothetical protein